MQSSQCPKLACLKSYVALAFDENPFLNPPVSELGAFETILRIRYDFIPLLDNVFTMGMGIGENTRRLRCLFPLHQNESSGRFNGFFQKINFATFRAAIVTPSLLKCRLDIANDDERERWYRPQIAAGDRFSIFRSWRHIKRES